MSRQRQGWVTDEGKIIRSAPEMHAAAAKREMDVTDTCPRAIYRMALDAGWILWRVESSGCASVDFSETAIRSSKAVTVLRRALGRPSVIYGDMSMWDDVADLTAYLSR
jgi:hypothetical protein